MHVHRGGEQREEVPRHPQQPRHKHLERQAKAVKRRCHVGYDAQAKKHRQELPKALRRRKHREQDPTDTARLVVLRPEGVKLRPSREGGGGAEAHERDDGEQEAKVGVQEYLPAKQMSVRSSKYG